MFGIIHKIIFIIIYSQKEKYNPFNEDDMGIYIYII